MRRAAALLALAALSLAALSAPRLRLRAVAQDTPGAALRSRILAPGAKVEKVAGGFKFTEGPVWMPQGFLLFSDIPNDAIVKWDPKKNGVADYRKPCGNTNGHTLDKKSRLISCEHTGRRVSRTEKDGTITTLADRYEGKRLNSPNDVVLRSDGSLFFTDPPYGLPDGTEGKELDFQGVYRIAPNGALTLLVRDFDRPNGIALSPDEKTLYVNDSNRKHIRAFPLRPDGTVGAGRVFADMSSSGDPGSADGMKVDVRGNVYSTGPGGVWVFDPKGTLLGRIIAPEIPANVGWGGRDFKTLYLTAQTGLYRVRCRIPGLRPGQKK